MTRDAAEEFISSLGSLMERWGLPQATGRLLGYLLLRNEPADLDTMVSDLGTSKSGMSVAARQLEAWALVRRTSQPGSRRVCYEVVSGMEQLLVANNLQIKKFSDTLREGSRAAEGKSAERLTGLADLFDLYVTQTQRVLDEHTRREAQL